MTGPHPYAAAHTAFASLFALQEICNTLARMFHFTRIGSKIEKHAHGLLPPGGVRLTARGSAHFVGPARPVSGSCPSIRLSCCQADTSISSKRSTPTDLFLANSLECHLDAYPSKSSVGCIVRRREGIHFLLARMTNATGHIAQRPDFFFASKYTLLGASLHAGSTRLG